MPDAFESDSLFLTVAHEGRHITDAWTTQYGTEGGGVITSSGAEQSAYAVTFLTAKGARFQDTVEAGGVAIYKKGWTKIDSDAMSRALKAIGKDPLSQGGNNPANWDAVKGRYLGRRLLANRVKIEGRCIELQFLKASEC